MKILMKLISIVLGIGPRLVRQSKSRGLQAMKSNAQRKEKRRSPRRESLMPAELFYPNQNQHLVCMVRDLSQDGALLDVPMAKQMPFVFWLRLDGETTLRFCTVAWRSDNHLGVEFTEQILDRQRIERWGEPAPVFSKQHALD
jgi:hypothetical protein